MKTYSKFLLILIIGFLLNSCEKNDLETPQEEIMPLEVGNYWKYILYDFEEEIESVIVDSISTDTIIDGEKWYFLYGTNAFLSNKNKGLWDKVGLYPKELNMKYPAKVGDNWDISRPGLPIEFKACVVSIDTPVEINNEIFKCYEYEYYENGILKRKHFASPSIGKVKTEIFISTSDDTVKLVKQAVLTEYNLN
jgi:hypothetical protein